MNSLQLTDHTQTIYHLLLLSIFANNHEAESGIIVRAAQPEGELDSGERRVAAGHISDRVADGAVLVLRPPPVTAVQHPAASPALLTLPSTQGRHQRHHVSRHARIPVRLGEQGAAVCRAELRADASPLNEAVIHGLVVAADDVVVFEAASYEHMHTVATHLEKWRARVRDVVGHGQNFRVIGCGALLRSGRHSCKL